MTGPGGDEMVVFSGAVHPSTPNRPAHGWFLKGQKTAIKSTSGRKRLNIQGALDPETFQFTFVEAERINAQTTQQMLEKLERNNPTMATIHVFLDNARYHHAKLLQPWLNSPDRKIRLHFLPAYAPHLNPIERLWGVMHKWVTHNHHYATSGQFTEAILKFFRKVLPDKWREFRDTVADNFRTISHDEYKIIRSHKIRPIQSFEYTSVGDIIICVRNGSLGLIGKTAQVKSGEQGFSHGAFMSLFRPRDPLLANQLFNTSRFKAQVHRNLGATINSINIGDMRCFKFAVPRNGRQLQVAQILDAQDAETLVLSKSLDQLRSEKAALMQQLLTGKRRVNVEEMAA